MKEKVNFLKRRTVAGILLCSMLLGLSACGREQSYRLSDLSENAAPEAASAGDSAHPVSDFVPDTERETVYIYICGEVQQPGVYEVYADARICDVVVLAGGLTQEAAPCEINLALPVEDGMQITVPSYAEQAGQAAEEEAYRQSMKEAGMVDLNTATAQELCSLPGIGESRAADIIRYREENGGFRTIEELMQVPGIKEGVFEKLKDRIFV